MAKFFKSRFHDKSPRPLLVAPPRAWRPPPLESELDGRTFHQPDGGFPSEASGLEHFADLGEIVPRQTRARPVRQRQRPQYRLPEEIFFD
jgi:hypothetical protein